MKARIFALFLVVLIAFAASAQAERARGDEDYTKHPGYVDFDLMDVFGQKEAKVEVSLKQPMLKLVSEFTKGEDPELYDMLAKLAVVRVYVFEADDQTTEKFDAESSKITRMLDGKGWERVVRVRDEDEHVFVYLKPSKGYDFIEGIVVFAIDDEDEAVFVNIAGEINPDDVSSLGEHFGISDLDGIDTHSHKKDKD